MSPSRAGQVQRLATAAGIALAVLLAWPAMPAHAQAAVDPMPLTFHDDTEEARFHALVAELRCVMCQNQSLADSNAQIAVDLRREVLGLMREGKSDRQIKQFLVERYGEFVLYRPQLEADTWLLWFGPAALLLAGGVVIAVVVRRRSRQAVPDAGDGTDGTDGQEW